MAKRKYVPMFKPYVEELPSFTEAFRAVILNLPKDERKERLMVILADSWYRMQMEYKGYRKVIEVYETPNGGYIFQHTESVTPEELDKHLLKVADVVTRKVFANAAKAKV